MINIILITDSQAYLETILSGITNILEIVLTEFNLKIIQLKHNLINTKQFANEIKLNNCIIFQFYKTATKLLFFEAPIVFCINNNNFDALIQIMTTMITNNNNNNNIFEENTYILQPNINTILKNELPNINNIVNYINNITIQLNNVSLHNKKIIELKKKRNILMKNIIQHISKTIEYFILPHVIPFMYISCNVALVGNSKKLLRHKYGHIIDSYTNVFRFNYAVTDNFEEYCGSKSDIRVGTNICLRCTPYPTHPQNLIKDYKLYKYLNEKRYVIFTETSFPSKKLKEIAIDSQIEILDKQYYNIIWNSEIFNNILQDKEINVELFKRKKNVQCGLGFLLLVLDLGIIPSIYGYDISLGSDNYGYYWSDNIIHTNLSKWHDIPIEHRIIKKLMDMELINYFN
jgi:hypothetical protein